MHNPSDWVAIPEKMAKMMIDVIPLWGFEVSGGDKVYLKGAGEYDSTDYRVLRRVGKTWFIHINKLHFLTHDER